MRQSVVNGRLPVSPGHWLALRIRNRDDWNISKSIENTNKVEHVETPVQSRDVRNRKVARDRKMKVTGMEMNHIEFAGVLDHVIY
jgi:hypothetical protein